MDPWVFLTIWMGFVFLGGIMSGNTWAWSTDAASGNLTLCLDSGCGRPMRGRGMKSFTHVTASLQWAGSSQRHISPSALSVHDNTQMTRVNHSQTTLPNKGAASFIKLSHLLGQDPGHQAGYFRRAPVFSECNHGRALQLVHGPVGLLQ